MKKSVHYPYWESPGRRPDPDARASRVCLNKLAMNAKRQFAYVSTFSLNFVSVIFRSLKVIQSTTLVTYFPPSINLRRKISRKFEIVATLRTQARYREPSITITIFLAETTPQQDAVVHQGFFLSLIIVCFSMGPFDFQRGEFLSPRDIHSLPPSNRALVLSSKNETPPDS